eukprot:scaffold14085_cov142-Isochrysis_galbana.AAC.3
MTISGLLSVVVHIRRVRRAAGHWSSEALVDGGRYARRTSRNAESAFIACAHTAIRAEAPPTMPRALKACALLAQ